MDGVLTNFRDAFKKIKRRIDEMIEMIRPEKIYIGVDGVAPLGKMMQQRQRRYRYLYERERQGVGVEEIEREMREYPISSIEITPGTEYMERIDREIERYKREIEERYRIECIYSSYKEEGEGEHKIMGYIREKVRREETVVIYGLDADLLFLGLSNVLS